MTNGKRTVDPIAVLIVIAGIAVPILILAGLFSLTKFRVYTNLSAKTRSQMADLARYRGIEEYIERYGERGPLDIDYQIETCTFSSIGDLGRALPGNSVAEPVDAELEEIVFGTASYGSQPKPVNTVTWIEKQFAETEPRNGRDLKGKKVKIYELKSYSPIDHMSYDSDRAYDPEDYWVWTYSVYEYPDGTYRFAANVYTS